MEPASGTVVATTGEVKLKFPYCGKHVGVADRYFTQVVGGMGSVVVGISAWIAGLVAGTVLSFGVLPELGVNTLWVQIPVSLVVLAIVGSTTQVGWERWRRQWGARRLGLPDPNDTGWYALGISHINVVKNPDPNGQLRLDIEFLNEEYARLFEAQQPPEHLHRAESKS
jgi:hypothetical protein